MKKYLITGGAGFIGSNFVRFLYNREPDAKVIVLDKLTYSANLKSLEDFKKRKSFQFIKGDICDPKIVSKIIKEAEVVINFAAEVAVDRSIDDPEAFLRTDIYGVYNLLNHCRSLKSLKKFIQISTDEVYGHLLKGSFKETSELKPRNPYSASKLGGERLAYSFYETFGLPVVITRASNTYGPQAYPEKVIPLFITNLMDGKKVPVFGEGRQIRDWLYVEDHCRALVLLLQKGANGQVYNIGGGQECTNMNLTRRILKMMSLDESTIEFVQDRPGHDYRYSLDSSKLKRLGWQPELTLEQGLQKTINWYRHNEEWWRPVKEKMDKRYITGYWGKKT